MTLSASSAVRIANRGLVLACGLSVMTPAGQPRVSALGPVIVVGRPRSGLPLLTADSADAPAAEDPPRPLVLLECRIFDSDLERDRWLASPHVSIFWSDHPDRHARRNLVGTTASVTGQSQRYLDDGRTDIAIYFRGYPTLDGVRTFMTEVVPALVG